MRFSNIAYSLSLPCLILAGSMLLPLGFSIYYRDGQTLMFLGHAGALLLLSLGMRLLNRRPRELSVREGFLVVSLSWGLMSLLGSLPFFFSRAVPSLTDAFFETMSGFTTTGATILRDIESVPESLLVWRAMTHWLGGMGVIALAVAIFPFLGVGAYQLFKAEVPGPIKDRISPRISQTAKILWQVYILFTAAETVLLMLGGLSFYEALNTTFATMATGGFTVKNANIAAFPSAYIHYVVIAFMFLAGVNFSLHYWALRGRIGSYLRDPEYRFFLAVILLATTGITFLRVAHGERLTEELVRGSLFQTVSIATTTGFITQNYELWPLAAQIILLLLMFTGGCSSSTGGAMKNVRIMVLFKFIGGEIKKLFHPHSLFPVKLGGKPVPEGVCANVMAFLAFYILFFTVGVFLLVLLELDLVTAVGAAAATLGNVGPGLGTVGAVENYAHLPALAKWVLSILMMAGRLEIFPIMVIFSRHFWR